MLTAVPVSEANAVNQRQKPVGIVFREMLGFDSGIEHFGPQIRFLRKQLPTWSISEV